MTLTLTLTRLQHAARRAMSYRRRFGWRATFTRLRAEWSRRSSDVARVLPPASQSVGGESLISTDAARVGQWLRARFPALEPLRVYRQDGTERRRVTLVTDSIGKGSLYGGVGTALILGTLLANRLHANLRIVTRTEPPIPTSVGHVLDVYGIQLDGEMEFRFAAVDDDRYNLDLFDGELVLTTSWWTTAASLPAVPSRNIVYLLQEDERMFYPFGDERLRCEQTLRRADLCCVVNSSLLFDHFVAEGFENIAAQGLHFEPAFPPRVFQRLARTAGAKRRFVFYARPNNARNLFFLGIEVIDTAVSQGVLNPEQWEIVFVGKDIPELSLSGGVVPQRRENLDWRAYARLMGEADLGLSLMYTPHPSYPPLDLVACGAVVVTNRFGVKQDLSNRSDNLICCDLDRDALVAGLVKAVALVDDDLRRAENHRRSNLASDWKATLSGVVDALADRR
jgi:O-antigen biosynthesis protein